MEDPLTVHEKWFALDDVEKEAAENHSFPLRSALSSYKIQFMNTILNLVYESLGMLRIYPLWIPLEAF